MDAKTKAEIEKTMRKIDSRVDLIKRETGNGRVTIIIQDGKPVRVFTEIGDDRKTIGID